MNERHFCLDCRQTGPLTQFGKCSTCGSQAVVSEHNQWVGFTEWAADAIKRVEDERAERLLDNDFDKSFMSVMRISLQ